MTFAPFKSTVTDDTGAIAPGAEISVRRLSDDQLADLYSDAGVTPLSNPFNADGTTAQFEFYTDPGRYTLTITKGVDSYSEVIVVAGAASILDQAYGRDTILGIVSQAAGVPTGAVIERGETADGAYVRLADGMQICCKLMPLGDIVASGAGTWASPYATPLVNWTYPAAFAETPEVFCEAVPPSSAPNRERRTAGMSRGAVNNTAAFNLTAWRVGDDATSDIFSASLFAVGRWF